MSKLIRIYLFIGAFICLTVLNCHSQNLIANGSFENYTLPVNCSGGGGGFDNYTVFPVNHVVDYWYSLNSPDYFSHLCSGPNNNGSPMNIFGYSQAKEGSNYSGFILFQTGDTKEYIYQQLSSSLTAGKIYCLSFYVSRADRITHAIHSIGAFFSNNAVSTNSLSYVNASPQVINQNGFITDTTQWQQIQCCFMAIGGEQYITIGNFNSNANTDTLYVGTNNPVSGAVNYSYYYIDDITLVDQSTVGVNEISNKNSFEVYPNPNTGLLKFSNLQYSNGDYNVKILDLFGKEIINEVLKEELDISSFDKGVYTLLLYKNKQLVVTKKVMKN